VGRLLFLRNLGYMKRWLWIVFLMQSLIAGAQDEGLDSLWSVLPQIPDSLRAPLLVEIASKLYNDSNANDARIDSALRLAYQAELLAHTYNDTTALVESRSIYIHYYRKTRQKSKLDSLLVLYQPLRAAMGYQIVDKYDSWNDFAGYRYAYLYNTLYILEDTTGDWNIADVSSPDKYDTFHRNQTTSKDLGNPNKVFWVRLKLRGHKAKNGDYLFMVGQDSYTWRDIQVYIPNDSGNYNLQITGSDLLPEQKTVQDWRSFFRVQLNREKEKEIYLRLQGPNNITVPPEIFLLHMDEPYLLDNEEKAHHNRGIFLGILWVQGVYFLLLFLSVKYRAYLFYVIYILGLILSVSNASYYHSFFPKSGEYHIFVYFIAAWIAAFGMIRFSEIYLNIREYLPKSRTYLQLYKSIFTFVAVGIIILITFEYNLSQFISYEVLNDLINGAANTYIMLISLGLILIMAIGIAVHHRGFVPARYLLFANIFLILGVGIPFGMASLNMGHLPFRQTMLAAEIGVILQLSFFALGVGNKQKMLEEEKKVALEQNLQLEHDANEKLRRTDEMKDEFLANTSHELRTPLNGIIGIAEGMMAGLENNDTSNLKENLSVIIDSGRRLNTMVNDLLDFSKLKNYDLELQRKPLDLRILTDIVLKVVKPLVKNKPIELHNKIPHELPKIWADENRIQQILYNLIGNAIKFTHEGNVTVRAGVIGELIEIIVSDSGIGIPPDKLETIFESFEQADGSIAREYGGSGLGLSITRRLIELHGGKIWVNSEVGVGSDFHFTIPAAKPQHYQYEIPSYDQIHFSGNPELQTYHISPEEDTESNDLNGISDEHKQVHILVVDDEPINQRVMKNILSQVNYRVSLANNGEEALRILETKKDVNLVLLDVMMPKMSGFEVCQRIREKHLPSELPVIIVTAKSQIEDLVTGLTSGANDYISKPFSRDELLARIRTHLNLYSINTVYGRFVPHEFIRSLGHSSIMEARLGDGVEREFTVMFSDIRSYTTLAEEMTPKENFDFINSYLGRMGPIIKSKEGFVAQYYGDGIMALFPNQPEDALQAAIDMYKKLADYNRERVEKSRIPIRIGIGLHTGPLLLGIIGDEKRMDAGVVSDTVNTSARMEGLTKYYGASILVSADTLLQMTDPTQFRYRYLGLVQVKGKKEPIGIYDFYDGDPPDIIQLKEHSLSHFEEGLSHYYNQQFQMAGKCFKKVLSIYPEDRAAKLYVNNSEKYDHEGIPDSWRGVEMILSK